MNSYSKKIIATSGLLLGFIIFFGLDRAAFSQVRPAFPVTPIAESLSACTLELRWYQPSPGAFNYQYYWSNDNFQVTEDTAVIPSTGGNLPNPPFVGNYTHRIQKLADNTPFWYEIQSCNSSFCSERIKTNNGSSVTTPRLNGLPGTPAVKSIVSTPHNLTGLGLVQDIEVSWDAVSDLTPFGGYLVYMSRDNGEYEYLGFRASWTKDAEGNPLYDRGAGALSLRVNNMPIVSDYAFKVRAYDSALGCTDDVLGPLHSGNQVVLSNFSVVVNLPEKPFFSNLSSVEDASPSVKLTWEDKSDNETFFEIWRSADGGVIDTYRAPANSSELTDPNVLPGRTYNYKIRACAGEQSCSSYDPYSPSTLSITVGTVRPELKARILYAEKNGEDSTSDVMLVWTRVTGYNTYNIQRGLTTDTVVSVAKVGGTSYMDHPKLGNDYVYVVTAEKTSSDKIDSLPLHVNLDASFILSGHGWAGVGDISNFNEANGLGWIKFNSDGNAVRYSVQADKQGKFSGLAWVSDYGWLSFNGEDLKGCPQGECEAKMDASGKISGWARFMARSVDSSPGGWSGWLKLRGRTRVGNEEYGLFVSSTSAKIEGEAWGGDVVGYLVLNHPACALCSVASLGDSGSSGVKVENVRVGIMPFSEEWCAEEPYVSVAWDYYGASEQAGATIRFIDSDTGAVAQVLTITGFDKSARLLQPLDVLGKNKTYRVVVVATDGSEDSDPAWSAAFNTPTHLYPLARFGIDPEAPRINELVTMRESSMDRSGGAYPIVQYKWELPNEVSAQREPSTVFSAFPAEVTLTVTDSIGSSCAATMEITGNASGSIIKRRRIFER